MQQFEWYFWNTNLLTSIDFEIKTWIFNIRPFPISSGSVTSVTTLASRCSLSTPLASFLSHRMFPFQVPCSHLPHMVDSSSYSRYQLRVTSPEKPSLIILQPTNIGSYLAMCLSFTATVTICLLWLFACLVHLTPVYFLQDFMRAGLHIQLFATVATAE